MEKAYIILTTIFILPFAGYVVFGATAFMRGFDKKIAYKWYTICSICLAIISIPRTILAVQLEKENIFFFGSLIVIFIYNSIVGIIAFLDEKKYSIVN